MHQVKLNVFALLKDLEKQAGHNLYMTDVSAKSGITRPTWDKILKGESDRIEFRTLAKLLDFFAAEGMPVGVGDLFSVSVDDS